jgi:hypothetical protein
MVLKLIKKALCRACIIFSLICTAYALIVIAANSADGKWLLDASRILLLFVASVIFGFANMLRGIKEISSVARHISHFALYLLAFYTCFILPLSLQSSTPIVAVVFFCVIYLITMGIYLTVSSSIERRKKK